MTNPLPDGVHVRDIAHIGSLIGDPARLVMLASLLDGRMLPAGELARAAGIAPSTASGHLGKLVDAGLLTVHQQGAHRYYGITNGEVAHAVEAIAAIAPRAARPLAGRRAPGHLREARMCYDHLAGRLGVALSGAFIDRGVLVLEGDEFMLGDGGETWFQRFGVDLKRARTRPRFAPACLDWSERRYHVAGGLGLSLRERLMELGWTKPTEDRAVRVTVEGRRGLEREFGVTLSGLPG